MKKQILYPKLTSRLFATVIDLTLLVIVLNPVMSFLSVKLLSIYFPEYHINKILLSNEEFKNTFGNINFTELRYLKYFCIMAFIQILSMMGYFVFMWRRFATTVGKYLLRIKIVDVDTYNNITIWQGIIRFLFLPTIIIGMLFIVFSEKKQGLHDKVAGTLVIKF